MGSRALTSDGVPARDYVAEPGSLKRAGSWVATAERNLDIVELVQRLDAENRGATPAEQRLIAQFTGWGASDIRNNLFKNVRRTRSGAEWGAGWVPSEWKALEERARQLLTGDALETAMQSTQYAALHQRGSDPSIWAGLGRLGFAGGKILEPGMGTGLFAIAGPSDVMAASQYVGVEMDKFTADVARHLLPEQQVIHGDYVKRKFPDGFFDAAIGNPPFSQTKISDDPAYRRHRFSLHDYFFAKTLDKVRPGGIVAFVTSRYTMDKLDDKARQFMAERADLLGAVRLPQTAFKQNAGTEVVTDVLFLQRRAPGQEAAGESWLGHKEIKAGEKPFLINEYFAAHPEMVLGEHSSAGSMYASQEYTVTPHEGDIETQFAKAVERLPENVYRDAPAHAQQDIKAKAANFDFNPKTRKEGNIYLDDAGNLMIVDQGRGMPLDDAGKPLSDRDKQWLNDYVGLRDAIKTAQADQLNDGPWEKSLAALNKAYDSFVKQFGPHAHIHWLVDEAN